MGPGSKPALATWFQERGLMGTLPKGFPVLSLRVTVVGEQAIGLGMEIDWQSASTVFMKSWAPSQTLRKPGMGGTHL